MKLFDYLDAAKLSEQITQGMVKRNDHPDLPLCILNYTPKAQFTPELWNEVTDKCRGLIYDSRSLEIVSRPFVKFWNYGDPRHPETMPENLPSTEPKITRKMDGSLGIFYRSEDRFGIATRGSFVSDQAKWATRYLEMNRAVAWPDGFTPLFEIVFPENQIVVKYDFSGLVLLAMVNNETGEESPREQLEIFAKGNGVRLVDDFAKPIGVCITEDIENEEGYVASWERPGTYPLRVKIKMETYCRLHRLMTQTNPVTVWEMLKDGLDLTTLTQEAPADFLQWVNAVESSLRNAYKTLEDAALSAMLEYEGEKNISSPEQRKQFASYATGKQPLTPILFSMLDRKNYSPIIWKMIRPSGKDRGFKVDIDE